MPPIPKQYWPDQSPIFKMLLEIAMKRGERYILEINVLGNEMVCDVVATTTEHGNNGGPMWIPKNEWPTPHWKFFRSIDLVIDKPNNVYYLNGYGN